MTSKFNLRFFNHHENTLEESFTNRLLHVQHHKLVTPANNLHSFKLLQHYDTLTSTTHMPYVIVTKMLH